MAAPSRRTLARGGLGLVGVLLGLAVIWLATTALLARSQIAAAQHQLSSIRSAISAGDLPTAAAEAAKLSAHADRAHTLTTGPAWWLAQKLPVLGRPIESVRGCATQADELSQQVLMPLTKAASGLSLRSLVDQGRVNLTPIGQAAPVLAAADQQLEHAQSAVNALPHNTWLHSVDARRTQFSQSLAQLQPELERLDRMASLVPAMLGGKGTQRYFVGLENEAESRGVGGVPGAFAIVTATDGQLAFSQFESDVALYHARTTLDLGPEYDQRYGPADPTNTYTNSTISPDFSDAARIWAAMWTKQTGQRIDGAIAIDPTAISYLLAATGPASLPDHTQVSAQNVVALTQQTLYRTHPDTASRKSYLLQIASAISRRLVGAPGSDGLVRAAAQGAAERRIVVWSADPQTEKTLTATGISGTLQAGSAPFAGFTTVNAVGGKLDYYLDRSMTYSRTGCGPQQSAVATFTLHRAVPATALPSYVTLREDKPKYPVKPGDNKVLVSYYATPGSRITSVTIDGRPIIVATSAEKGLTVFTVPMELPRGSSHVVRVALQEPARTGQVQILRQPAVNPVTVSVHEQSC